MQKLCLLSASVIVSLSLSACSFVQDRSQEEVQIVDAVDPRVQQRPIQPQPKPKVIQPKSYYVISGDTLGIIAEKTMGSASLYRELAAFNNIDVVQSLTVGQKLLIPSQYQSSGNNSTSVQAISRPKSITINRASNTDLSDMEQLISSKQYNQAIDWAISNPELNTNLELQNKLVIATKQQVAIERSEKDYSEAAFLIQGILENNSFSSSHQTQLKQLATQVQCEQASYNALGLAKSNNTEAAYTELTKAFSSNQNYSETLSDFVEARSIVTESMHQDALKLYRNQQLKPALDIWDKILAVKPNDDLALVYKDRVHNLQKKLQDL
ncbi:MAG: LysM peptidoglycan-binding domain-containing protein [Gammaproteobacteria bacterium]|nr:LysM peptidoglycan-binding domain-containing protein [Gammaproteobacteria bacterium]